VERVFETAGAHTVSLEVDDGSGTACALRSAQTTVLINHPPIADAGGDREAYFGGANDAVIFDAGASSDVDGDSLGFTWLFEDDIRVRGQRIYHAFTCAGSHEVVLEVDDGSGLPCAINRDTITVTVRDHNAEEH
jgi:hypothetical protein